MSEVLIKARHFTINDTKIINEIKRLQVDYVKPEFTCDYDGSTIISVLRCLCNEDISNKYIKIHFDASCYIRTPSSLLSYVGQKVCIYRDESAFKNIDELFRIKPIGFDFDQQQLVDLMYPYFTNTGNLVLPATYLNTYFNKSIVIRKVSFSSNSIDNMMITRTVIVSVIPFNQDNALSFKIRFKNNYAVITVSQLILNAFKEAKIDPANLKYRESIIDDEFPYGAIIFQENK